METAEFAYFVETLRDHKEQAKSFFELFCGDLSV